MQNEFFSLSKEHKILRWQEICTVEFSYFGGLVYFWMKGGFCAGPFNKSNFLDNWVNKIPISTRPYGSLFLLWCQTETSFSFHLQVMIPFLTEKLARQYVAVDAAGLLMSTLEVCFSAPVLLWCLLISIAILLFPVLWIQVVLLPVLAGAFLDQYFQSLVKFVSPLMPPIAVGTVGILWGCPVNKWCLLHLFFMYLVFPLDMCFQGCSDLMQHHHGPSPLRSACR